MTEVGTCIECGARLEVVLAIERSGKPHGAAKHDAAYAKRTLSRCAAGHGQLEAYSHDCWSHDEDWDLYWWFLLSPAETAELLDLMRACPRPLAGTCRCPLHRSLRASCQGLWATRGATSPSGPRLAARITLVREGDLPTVAVVRPAVIV
jgi:hypothetical protein